MQTTFYVGENPGGTWRFQVRNSKTGEVEPLNSFTSARTILLDSQNREVELPVLNTAITNAAAGEVTFFWPDTNTFVFDQPGRWVMQVELVGGSSIRKPSVIDILVKDAGGVVK